MTLVVAKKKGAVLSLASDTGISLNGAPLGFEQHLPKICILNDQLVVGFSGSPELAVSAIESAPCAPGSTYAEVTGHFLKAHLDSEQGIEFIIAFGAPLSKFALVSGGRIRQNGTNEWIGDQSGFEAFQQFRQDRISSFAYIVPMLSTNQGSEAKTPTFDLIGSMREVIARRDIPSVFGHPVGVSNVDGRFQYRSYTVTLEEKDSFTVPAGTHPSEVMAAISEAKNYAFSCFVSSPDDQSQAIAFHYMRAKLTYVYSGEPGKPLSRFQLYRDLNVIDLAERAKAELGVNWIGGVHSRTGLPKDYGVPADQWRGMGRKGPPL